MAWAEGLRLVSTYAGLFLALRGGLSAEAGQIAAAGRAAWVTALLTVGLSGEGLGPALGVAVGAAAWTAAGAIRPRLRVFAIVGGGLLVTGWGAVGTGGAVAIGLWLAGAMRRRSFDSARAVAWWASFLGTFAWVLPKVASEWRGGEASGLELRWLAPPLGMIGAWLLWHGGRDLVVSGGTPEPTDPPLGLADAGIYARIRNPIQVGQIAVIGASCAWLGTAGALVYWLGLSLALVGPLRWVEERGLAMRYGEGWVRYRGAVPAYWPRIWR